MKAITSNANVLRTAHITVRPMYMHKKSHLGAKYPPSLFVPVHSKIILCSVCEPAYAFQTNYAKEKKKRKENSDNLNSISK